MSDDKTITLTLPVVIPAGLIPDGYEAVRVCSGTDVAEGELIVGRCDGGLRLIVRPKPTWTPPASLAAGEYLFKQGELRTGTNLRLNSFNARSVFRDWTDPPRDGIWLVNEDGTATYLGPYQYANER